MTRVKSVRALAGYLEQAAAERACGGPALWGAKIRFHL